MTALTEQMLRETVERTKKLVEGGHNFPAARVTLVTERGNFMIHTTENREGLPYELRACDAEIVRSLLNGEDVDENHAGELLEDILRYLREQP